MFLPCASQHDSSLSKPNRYAVICCLMSICYARQCSFGLFSRLYSCFSLSLFPSFILSSLRISHVCVLVQRRQLEVEGKQHRAPRVKRAYRPLSQQQLLEEAKRTELKNRQSLEAMLRMEDEKKRVVPRAVYSGPVIRFHSKRDLTSISFINQNAFEPGDYPAVFFSAPPAGCFSSSFSFILLPVHFCISLYFCCML